MVAAAVEATHVIGVDLGGTKILAGLVNREGRITRETQLPTPTSSTGDLIDALEKTVAGLLEPGVGAIGFGIPGTIDQTRGRVEVTVNLPLVEFDFRDWMQRRFNLPVGIDNDANAAAYRGMGVRRGPRDPPHGDADAGDGDRRRPDPGR